MGQISLLEGPLAKYGEGGKYNQLFLGALRQYGMLCIGLYRYIDKKGGFMTFRLLKKNYFRQISL